MKRISSALTISTLMLSLLSCGNEQATTVTSKEDSAMAGPAVSPSVKEDAVSYKAGDETMNSYVAYDANKQGRRPIVLVVPEWWGLTEYPRMRAKELAELGYLAMAVDMYGNGTIANNPQEAQNAATPFYSNPQLGKTRLDAALEKAKSLPQADTSQVVAIGYCFGGSMVLNYGKMGAPVKGVVSFHGGLETVPPQKGVTAQFLICQGGADSFVPQAQVTAFKQGMDSAGIPYTFKVYEGATHAFTNPNATELGNKFNMPIRYNPAADSASWNDMKEFFGRILTK